MLLKYIFLGTIYRIMFLKIVICRILWYVYAVFLLFPNKAYTVIRIAVFYYKVSGCHHDDFNFSCTSVAISLLQQCYHCYPEQ